MVYNGFPEHFQPISGLLFGGLAGPFWSILGLLWRCGGLLGAKMEALLDVFGPTLDLVESWGGGF